MQYTDYIAADHARREREQQLINKYQGPVHPIGDPQKPEDGVLWVVIGIGITGIIIILSIWL